MSWILAGHTGHEYHPCRIVDEANSRYKQTRVKRQRDRRRGVAIQSIESSLVGFQLPFILSVFPPLLLLSHRLSSRLLYSLSPLPPRLFLFVGLLFLSFGALDLSKALGSCGAALVSTACFDSSNSLILPYRLSSSFSIDQKNERNKLFRAVFRVDQRSQPEVHPFCYANNAPRWKKERDSCSLLSSSRRLHCGDTGYTQSMPLAFAFGSVL